MMRDEVLAPEYRNPVIATVVTQLLLGLLCAALLDGGDNALIFGIAMAGFWVCVTAIFCRRAKTPTNMDLAFIRSGFLPVFVVAEIVVRAAWTARGLT